MTDMDKTIEEAKSDMMPYESWERLAGESTLAFSAFCAFRDLGAERNIRKAVEIVETDKGRKRKNITCGVIGVPNSAGVRERLIMTAMLKN